MKTTDISVEYVDSMGSDLSVVNAARVSFDKTSDWVYQEEEKVDVESRTVYTYKKPVGLKEADGKLIKYLARHGHWTPFGHTSLCLRIKAPIYVARQLVKHQVGLVWNEVSRRYVDTEPEFYIPKVFHKRPDASIKQGSGEELTSIPLNITDVVEHCLNVYNAMIEANVAPEEARMVLPLNTMTEWIWTGNVASFARVCNLRLDSHAQLDTQKVAKKIHEIMLQYFPVSTEALIETTG